jgi:hypothetical protein
LAEIRERMSAKAFIEGAQLKQAPAVWQVLEALEFVV